MKASALRRSCEMSPIRDQTFLERWFPVPQVLAPQASGIDISDSSIKFLTLRRGARGFEVEAFAQGALPPGIVVNGIVKDPAGLGNALAEMQKEARAATYVHIALPEEAAYVFVMHVQDVKDPTQVRTMIEFEFEGRVPLKPSQTVYDYDVLSVHPGGGSEIAVTVFPKDIVAGYIAACAAAGLTLLSLEIEARSIARAVIPYAMEGASLMVDFGRARTGIAIFKGQIPIFTSTVEVGGDTITHIVMDQMKVDEAQAEEYKNNKGILPNQDTKVGEVIIGTASALADEVLKHYQYWDSRRNEHGERDTPIEHILLTGGSSNLKGLPEYLAGRVKAPTTRVDVWRNVCSFDHYIPSITENHALGLSTVIGLALRNA